MQKIYTLVIKLGLMAILILSIFSNYHYCFAEDPKNTFVTQESTQPVEIGLRKKVVDFSNGPQGFHLNDFWKIQEEELQFIPNEFSKSLFYYLTFQEYTLSNYIISVNARWISGSDYSPYGLLFKCKNNCYYAFVTSVNGYIMLLKYDYEWKTIKRLKNKNYANATYDSLKIICNGPAIKCFVNEKKVFEYKDKNQIQNAYVGLCSEGNVKCGFKNFTIEELP